MSSDTAARARPAKAAGRVRKGPFDNARVPRMQEPYIRAIARRRVEHLLYVEPLGDGPAPPATEEEEVPPILLLLCVLFYLRCADLLLWGFP